MKKTEKMKMKKAVKEFVKIVSKEKLTLDLMLLFSKKISAKELAENLSKADAEQLCDNLYDLFCTKSDEIESAREHLCCCDDVYEYFDGDYYNYLKEMEKDERERLMNYDDMWVFGCLYDCFESIRDDLGRDDCLYHNLVTMKDINSRDIDDDDMWIYDKLHDALDSIKDDLNKCLDYLTEFEEFIS